MKKVLLALIVVVVLISGCIDNPTCLGDNCTPNNTIENNSVISPANTFTSAEEIANYLEEKLAANENYDYDIFKTFDGGMRAEAVTASADTSAGASDYSTTNIQVEGVDEADIIKNDGKYIYVVSNNKVFIIDAYPASGAKLLSKINDAGMHIEEIFINGNKLVVFGRPFQMYNDVIEPWEDEIAAEARITEEMKIPYDTSDSFIKVYDLTRKENPILIKNLLFSGDYFNSRMIGNNVYTIFNEYVYLYDDKPVPMPVIIENNTIRTTSKPTDIQYFPDCVYPNTFTRIVSLDLNNLDNITSEIYLTDSSNEIYISEKNIYLTYQTWSGDQVAIRRISIKDGKIQHQSQGNVSGRILNQFSMDEYDNHFRIATTSGNMWSDNNPSQNNVYILNQDLELTGKIEGIAPGESIYSARFMGGRAYLVTFKRVDPLFTLDLSDHSNPKILGKLKIPGYSDYLHPYDENHLIGIGKEVDPSIDAELVHSDNAIYYTAIQGVKLAIFDITDIKNPKEMYKEVIGDRGSDSLASTDHRAFLFDREKNLLVVPILLAELNEGQPKSQEGDFTFQGAYVYDISLENGFQLKGRVGHATEEDFLKSGYNFYSNAEVIRSLYMDTTLFTISNAMIKANSLIDMSAISTVLLE